MLKPLSHTVVVIAMLIAFMGQAVAYTPMSCEASHQAKAQMAHSTMQHADSAGASMNHSTPDTHGNCCDADCGCPTGACSTVTLAGSEPYVALDLPQSEGVASQPSSQTTSFSTSLFRPPIFTFTG